MKAAKYTKETILGIGVIERNFPEFAPGDTISVSLKVQETGLGNKDKKKKERAKENRTQNFDGIVVGMKGGGINKTFTIRKITCGVAVEKIIPFYSPIITEIKLLKYGIVRRAKLFYLRNKKGVDALVKTRNKRVAKTTEKKSIAAAA